MSQQTADIADILDRVTRAEERVLAMDRRQEEWHRETKESRDEVARRLASIEASLSRYQGAWGAVVLVASAVGVALTFMKDFLIRKLFGEH